MVIMSGMGNFTKCGGMLYLFLRGTWQKTRIMMISCVLQRYVTQIVQVWMHGTYAEHRTMKKYIIGAVTGVRNKAMQSHVDQLYM